MFNPLDDGKDPESLESEPTAGALLSLGVLQKMRKGHRLDDNEDSHVKSVMNKAFGQVRFRPVEEMLRSASHFNPPLSRRLWGGLIFFSAFINVSTTIWNFATRPLNDDGRLQFYTATVVVTWAELLVTLFALGLFLGSVTQMLCFPLVESHRRKKNPEYQGATLLERGQLVRLCESRLHTTSAVSAMYLLRVRYNLSNSFSRVNEWRLTKLMRVLLWLCVNFCFLLLALAGLVLKLTQFQFLGQHWRDWEIVHFVTALGFLNNIVSLMRPHEFHGLYRFLFAGSGAEWDVKESNMATSFELHLKGALTMRGLWEGLVLILVLDPGDLRPWLLKLDTDARDSSSSFFAGSAQLPPLSVAAPPASVAIAPLISPSPVYGPDGTIAA